MASIKKLFKNHPIQEQSDLNTAFKAVQADSDAQRAAIVGITAKLDADAGVTDTNYASTLDPAANTLVD